MRQVFLLIERSSSICLDRASSESGGSNGDKISQITDHYRIGYHCRNDAVSLRFCSHAENVTGSVHAA
jgi:hypothetical protein